MRRLAVLLLLAGCAAPSPYGPVLSEPVSRRTAPEGLRPLPRRAARPAAPEAFRAAPSLARLGADVHAEANRARRRSSRRSLAWDPELAGVAEAHSRDMARRGYFDHVSPDGHDPQHRARQGGVDCRVALGDRRSRVGIAENLYMTTRYASAWERRGARRREVLYDWMTADAIAKATVRSWTESPGHRRNLLDENARAHGIGVTTGRDHRVYITQVLC